MGSQLTITDILRTFPPKLLKSRNQILQYSQRLTSCMKSKWPCGSFGAESQRFNEFFLLFISLSASICNSVPTQEEGEKLISVHPLTCLQLSTCDWKFLLILFIFSMGDSLFLFYISCGIYFIICSRIRQADILLG